MSLEPINYQKGDAFVIPIDTAEPKEYNVPAPQQLSRPPDDTSM